jgi:type II secretory pathway predicted ATPase ExeA
MQKRMKRSKNDSYRSDAKRQLTREISNLIEIQKRIPVIITDEAHLLSREMLEKIRFLLNFKMDSYNPMSLILVGQSELKDVQKNINCLFALLSFLNLALETILILL